MRKCQHYQAIQELKTAKTDPLYSENLGNYIKALKAGHYGPTLKDYIFYNHSSSL